MLNIFEHNTPLHDGAIIVRGNRIISATCYLPLSDNMELSKELGTRHRAGVGISEVTDSLTIIVSEETGKVSIAQKGVLTRDVTPEELAGMITTETPTDTRIMSISVTDDDPKEAKQIADTLRKAVSVQITEIMNADSVNTVEEGNLPTSPSSPNVKKNMMLGALLGLVISMGFVVLISILDDTVKTPDDRRKVPRTECTDFHPDPGRKQRTEEGEAAERIKKCCKKQKIGEEHGRDSIKESNERLPEQRSIQDTSYQHRILRIR